MKILKVEHEDLEWLRKARNDPETYKYFNQFSRISKKEQELWYWQLGSPYHAFIVWEGKKRIGYVALKDINQRVGSAEFSIFTVPSERKRGYGTKALKLILEYGFYTLNLQVIHSTVYRFNPAIETYEAFGFKIDGLLRRRGYKDGKYQDSYYISILKEEYDKLYNNNKQEVSS